MTTPLSLHVEPGEPLHHDTLPAIQAAFELGRAEYLQRMKVLAQWEAGGGMERVLRALSNVGSSGVKCWEPAKRASNISVVGGGDSLAGKIRWLIENEEPRTSKQLAERLGVSNVSDVSSAASLMFRRGSIGRRGRFYTKEIGEVAA